MSSCDVRNRIRARECSKRNETVRQTYTNTAENDDDDDEENKNAGDTRQMRRGTRRESRRNKKKKILHGTLPGRGDNRRFQVDHVEHREKRPNSAAAFKTIIIYKIM